MAEVATQNVAESLEKEAFVSLKSQFATIKLGWNQKTSLYVCSTAKNDAERETVIEIADRTYGTIKVVDNINIIER